MFQVERRDTYKHEGESELGGLREETPSLCGDITGSKGQVEDRLYNPDPSVQNYTKPAISTNLIVIFNLP